MVHFWHFYFKILRKLTSLNLRKVRRSEGNLRKKAHYAALKVSTTAGSRKAASEGDSHSLYNCPMFAVRKVILLTASISLGSRASASLLQQKNGTAWPGANSAMGPNVSECVLLFGAFCNGNLGDVIQASTMSRLITKVAPDSTCIWHAHPSKEKMTNGFREGIRSLYVKKVDC